MKVINIHKRAIQQPKADVASLLNTLATDNDMMLATDKWPRMKLDKVENHCTKDKKSSKWNLWVRTLRKIMKPKRK